MAVNQAGESFNVLPYDDVVSCHIVILKGEILTTLMMMVMTTMMVIVTTLCLGGFVDAQLTLGTSSFSLRSRPW